MKSGIISLYYRDGEFVSAREYASKFERNEIISLWRKRYAAAFNRTFIQILPNTTDMVKSDGTNKMNNRTGKRDLKNEFCI